MKTTMLVTLIVLCLGSVALRLSQPDTRAGRPVLTWVTDLNPARAAQVEAFHAWLIAEGHTTLDGGPAAELRVDAANRTMTKQMIQAVSGVGGDLMDSTGGAGVRLFHAMGVTRPLSPQADARGYGVGSTWAFAADELVVDGRQHAYPANAASKSLFVNRLAFEAVGVEAPRASWTLAEFETHGRRYVAAANPPGTHPRDRRFFAGDYPTLLLHRTLGLSVFNETATACTLDDPRYAEALETKRRWIHDDRLLPTPDDVASFATASGYGGTRLALLREGRYAMVIGGRWFAIGLRQRGGSGGARGIGVVEPPSGGFPNTLTLCRPVVVYAGSEHPELAELFLEFLASEPYNRLIIRDADALPPNPAFLDSEAYARPPEHPEEWGIHAGHARIAEEQGIGMAYSPFVLDSEVQREMRGHEERFLIGQLTAPEAAARTGAALDRRIAATVERKPELGEAWDRLKQVQRAIDARHATGEPIPSNWVSNPFHLRHLAHLGRLGPPEPVPAS